MNKLLNEIEKTLIGDICSCCNPKDELNTVCIDYKTKRIYATDTTRLIIFYMNLEKEKENIYYIDKNIFLNSAINIKEEGVFIGRNEIKPFEKNKKFNYPSIERIIPNSYESIYEITDFEIGTLHHLLVKHNFHYNPNYINALVPFFELTNKPKCYLKINHNSFPILISMELSGRELMKYLIMPILSSDDKKDFKKIKR